MKVGKYNLLNMLMYFAYRYY